ncbi:MAG: hypothetical protein ACRBDI_02915 [Alphaproteobacteria bacterium]
MKYKKAMFFLSTTVMGCLLFCNIGCAKDDILTKSNLEEFYNSFASAKLKGGDEYIHFHIVHFDDSINEIKRIKNNFPKKDNEEQESRAEASVMERNKTDMIKTAAALSKMNKYHNVENEILSIYHDPQTGNLSTKIKTTARFDMYRYGFDEPFHVDEVMICDDVLTKRDDIIIILKTDCTVDFNIDRRI